jgi:hypothetical protein
MASILKNIKTVQEQVGEVAEVNKDLQSYLTNFKLPTEDELYDLSGYLEPKEGREPPVKPPVLDQYVQFGVALKESAEKIEKPSDVHHSIRLVDQSLLFPRTN